MPEPICRGGPARGQRSAAHGPAAGISAPGTSVVRLLQQAALHSPSSREETMNLEQQATGVLLSWTLLLTPAVIYTQASVEVFSATATVKAAGGAAASAPVTVTVDRKMPQSEVDGLIAALKNGGAAGLRKALVGVPPTGSVRLGGGAPVPSRITIERTTDKGRLLTILTDKPLGLLGAGMAGAKPKEGYDFGLVDIEVDGSGRGSGTLMPATKVVIKGSALVVGDYSGELIQLTSVAKAK
jgi:hypothetical protein